MAEEMHATAGVVREGKSKSGCYTSIINSVFLEKGARVWKKGSPGCSLLYQAPGI